MASRFRHDSVPAAGPELVLIAEDSIEDSIYLRHILARQGATVRTAHNGEEAVRLARAEAFDLILMDVSMPRMDGVAAVREIRAIERLEGRAPAHIEMTSSHGEMEDIAWSAEAGADGHLVKPVGVKDVLGALYRARAQRGAAA